MAAPDLKPTKRIIDKLLMKRLHLELVHEPCERCGLRAGVALHHRTFRGQGGDDTRENLEWLCRPCHDAAHGL